MKMMLKVPACLLLCLALAQTSSAQEPIAQVAEDVSKRIANSGRYRVIVDVRFRCKSKKCGALVQQVPDLLKTALANASLPPEMLSQSQLELVLQQHGFQPIDSYFSAVLKATAGKLNAFFLTGSTELKDDRTEVTFELHDGKNGKRVYRKKVTLPRANAEPPEEPVICDSRANVCLASRGSVGIPVCEWCPNPEFSDEAIARRVQGKILLLVTVTREGAASHLSLLQGLGSGLDEMALARVQTWRFKPARDATGQPVATRVTIEINFRQG